MAFDADPKIRSGGDRRADIEPPRERVKGKLSLRTATRVRRPNDANGC